VPTLGHRPGLDPIQAAEELVAVPHCIRAVEDEHAPRPPVPERVADMAGPAAGENRERRLFRLQVRTYFDGSAVMLMRADTP